MKKKILKSFQVIPGVGPSIASDLREMGYRSVDGLRGENPEEMYAALSRLKGMHVDRCMLYVFRCAAYFVE